MVNELEQNEEEKIISIQIGLLMSSLMFVLAVPGQGAELSYTEFYEELKYTFGNNI